MSSRILLRCPTAAFTGKNRLRRAVALLLATPGLMVCPAGGASLEESFAAPPPASRPWTFWYWMNNHVSRDGITRDLEAMKRFGIGTALIGNVSMPDLPDGPVPLLSEEWLDLTAFAVRESRRVGLDLGFFNSPGWSQSGGPWVTPTQTMRFLNWSETRVRGGERFDAVLPAPRTPFQDVALLAVPVDANDAEVLRQRAPRIDAPGSPDLPATVADGNTATILRFPPKSTEMTITFEADRPFSARSLTLHPSQADFTLQAELRAANADGSFRSVRTFDMDRSNNRLFVGPVPYAPVTISFPEVTASRWQVALTRISTRDPNAVWLDTKDTSANAGLAEIELSSAARIERVQEKQLAKLHPTPTPHWDTYQWPEQAETPGVPSGINPTKVIDLTKQLQPDGKLQWQAPAGQWLLLRIGMSPTGINNHPAPPNATGPEIDKMNRAAATHHFNSFVGRMLSRLSPDDKSIVKYLGVDSYEVGSQNWTDDNAADFQRRFGYDPTPWLPVLAGRVVGSATQSNRFLWDLRRQVADRVAYDYAGGLADVAHAHGLKLWLQNYGHWGFPGEFLQYGGQADMVSGEFWSGKDLGGIECRAAASASHTYGFPVTFGEAFTSSDFFDFHPYLLKARGDWAFCEGINQLVIQVSMHQPDEKRPGVNAWFGTEFNRHNTWYHQGRAWTDYLARCHFLLQQGKNVANVAYFIGEDTPAMTGPTTPALPPGYGFDFINAEVIRDRLSVRDGRFVLSDGTTYDLLVLPALKTMRPDVLAKLRDLVHAGGTLLGPRPERSPSLANYPASDEVVRKIADEVWNESGKLGRGRVFGGSDLVATLQQLGVDPDVSGLDSTKTLWTHRSTETHEVYFLSNQTEAAMNLSPVFRVTGRAPELWDAVTGEITRTARHAPTPHGTRVNVHLGSRGSIFVVFPQQIPAKAESSIISVTRDAQPDPGTVIFRHEGGLIARIGSEGVYQFERGGGTPFRLDVPSLPEPLLLSENWSLRFPAGMDTPDSVTLPRLIPWNEHGNEAIKYFSGTVTYEKALQVSAAWIASGRRIHLELGRVEVIADVIINGQAVGTTWLPPYRLDVTPFLRAGENKLEIKATNLWRNRILGDLKYPAGFPSGPRPKQFQTSLFTLGKWDRADVLQPSGVLGPVRLLFTQDYELQQP